MVIWQKPWGSIFVNLDKIVQFGNLCNKIFKKVLTAECGACIICVLMKHMFYLIGGGMRSKDKTLMAAIERFVCEYADRYGYSPSMQEIADGVGSSKPTVYRYISQMNRDGILEYSGVRNVRAAKDDPRVARTNKLGEVPCGLPKLAEENIEECVKLPVSLFGEGPFYLLTARGESMIEAGIDDGDWVLVRQQDTAEPGKVVVALIGDEATLKRYYPEPENHRIRLHPENSTMEDIYVDSCEIQGVAVSVFKDLT